MQYIVYIQSDARPLVYVSTTLTPLYIAFAHCTNHRTNRPRRKPHRCIKQLPKRSLNTSRETRLQKHLGVRATISSHHFNISPQQRTPDSRYQWKKHIQGYLPPVCGGSTWVETRAHPTTPSYKNATSRFIFAASALTNRAKSPRQKYLHVRTHMYIHTYMNRPFFSLGGVHNSRL